MPSFKQKNSGLVTIQHYYPINYPISLLCYSNDSYFWHFTRTTTSCKHLQKSPQNQVLNSSFLLLYLFVVSASCTKPKIVNLTYLLIAWWIINAKFDVGASLKQCFVSCNVVTQWLSLCLHSWYAQVNSFHYLLLLVWPAAGNMNTPSTIKRAESNTVIHILLLQEPLLSAAGSKCFIL